MLHRRSLALPLVFLALALAALPGALAAQPAPAAVAAPVLKWQRGGCTTSSCQTGWYSSPAVADLNGDGRPEVIWGSYDLVALDGATGALVWRATNGSRVWPGVVVTDLTGDGTLEVIAGRGGDQVTVYSASGAVLWSRNPFGGGEVRTLAVEDLDGDGPKEIIVGRASGGATKQVHVFEADGRPRAGFPARRDGEAGYGWGMYNQNVAVADLDGDGDAEIIAPTDTHYITALDHRGGQLPVSPIYGAGKVWSQVGVHVDHPVDLRGYANCGTEHRPNFANTAPVIADMDGDGTREIIIVGDVYNCGVGDPAGDLYHLPWIFRLDRTRWSGAGFDWTTIPTAKPGSGPLSQDYNVIQNSATSVAVADLDGDGQLEIIYPSYDGRMHAFWLDKTERGAWPFKVPGSGMRFASEPAIVDLDGDGRAEVIFTSWPQNGGGRIGQLHILDSLGNQLHAVDLPAPHGGTWNGGLGAPTVANIDGDPDMEVVVGTVSSGVVAYDLPGSAGASCRWCTGRGNMRRTGVALAADGFTMQLQPAQLALAPGETATLRVAIRSEGTFSGNVTLGVSAPAGVTAQLSATSLAAPGEATVTISAPAGGSLPAAWHTVTVTANSGAIQRTASVSVLVGGRHVYLPAVGR